VGVGDDDHRPAERRALGDRRTPGAHHHEVTLGYPDRHVVEKGRYGVSRGERRWHRRGRPSNHLVVEAAALVDDAEVWVIAEQPDDAAGDGAVETACPLGSTCHQDLAQPVADRPRSHRAYLSTDRVAGMDDSSIGQVAGGLGERRRDRPGSPGEQPGRASRHRVLFEQHHRDSLGQCRDHDRHRNVPAGPDDDIRAHPPQQSPGRDGRAGELGRRPRDAPRAAHVDATHLEGLEAKPGSDHQAFGHPVAAAHHNHLAVRRGVS
jgi:hypothetical protein